MPPLEVAKTVYAAFNIADIETILSLMNPTIEWTETAGPAQGGVRHRSIAPLQHAKLMRTADRRRPLRQ